MGYSKSSKSAVPTNNPHHGPYPFGRIFGFLALLCLYSLASCSQQHQAHDDEKHKFTNQLINESSPYLLQHAHNPVNWQPWGEAALEQARKENKLILVSIGYAACHWCHVMERETFEDEEVARYMNEHFVSIKVDREERPDVDQVYMTAIQLLTGSGGWPLNCVALPDGRPLYGGTYFRKEQWMDMLSKVLAFAEQNPEKAESQAQSLTRGVQSSETIQLNPEPVSFSNDALQQVFGRWKNQIDFTQGGFSSSPKFPLPIGLQFLLHYNYVTSDPKALEFVTLTLDKMADGGIYDQVGGGFARYSTDAVWKVPHFEKMLYDNAQLVSLYAAAFQQSKTPRYKTVVEETLEFIRRELTADDGGFYSSLDADSEGVEGKYYVWSIEELTNLLGDQAGLVADYYNVSRKGNWEEGTNILYRSGKDKQLSARYKISEQELQTRIQNANRHLLTERSKRIRPGLDNKVLTAWNALMTKAYVDAYRVLGDDRYLASALKNAALIKKKVRTSENHLYRTYKGDKPSINGFLDDYAFTIEAFISLYQATSDERWLTDARALTDYAFDHFFDTQSGMFFYTSNLDPPLVARKMGVSDQVIPSSNSTMAKNLFMLGHYFYDDQYIQTAKQMLLNVQQEALTGGVYFANWNILQAWFSNEPYEVAIVGPDHQAVRKEFDKHYFPNVFLSGGATEGQLTLLANKLVPGKTILYVCRDKVCKLPTTDLQQALKQINR